MSLQYILMLASGVVLLAIVGFDACASVTTTDTVVGAFAATIWMLAFAADVDDAAVSVDSTSDRRRRRGRGRRGRSKRVVRR